MSEAASETPKPAEEWVISTDEERFTAGPFATREEAIEAAPREMDLGPGEVFWTGRAVEWQPRLDADTVLDQLWDQAWDEVGDLADDWPPKLGDEAEDELSRRLTDVLQGWLAEHGALPTFRAVRDVEQHTVPEKQKSPQ